MLFFVNNKKNNNNYNIYIIMVKKSKKSSEYVSTKSGLGQDKRADEILQVHQGGRLFEVIRNPETGKNVSIYGRIGEHILRKYVTQLGGNISSRIPSQEPIYMNGGVSIKTAPKSSNKKKEQIKKMIKKGKTVHPIELKKTGVKVNNKGGFIRSGSIIPFTEPFNMSSQKGGHTGPCSVNPKSDRCYKSSKWDKQMCVLKKGRCSPTTYKKSSSKKASAKKTGSKKASAKKSSSENKQQNVVKHKIYGQEWGETPADEELVSYSHDDDEEIDYEEMERIEQEFRKQELIEEYGSLEAAQDAFDAYEDDRIDKSFYR
jgi:hypothetical protein